MGLHVCLPLKIIKTLTKFADDTNLGGLVDRTIDDKIKFQKDLSILKSWTRTGIMKSAGVQWISLDFRIANTKF